MMMRRWLWLAGIVCGMALAFPSLHAARADAVDGTFQITLSGRTSSSQIGTDAQGNAIVTLTQDLHSDDGQYPAVALELDITQTHEANGQQRISGTATVSDPYQQATLFTAQVTGAVRGDGLEQYTLTRAQAATGSGGTLIWRGLVRSSKLGDLTGTAAGRLVLTSGLPAGVAARVWPGAAGGSRSIDPTLWYITRGAALTAYVLLALVTVLGLGINTRAFDSVARRARVLDLHQWLTLLLVAFIALHLVTLALDPFLTFTIGQLLWPAGEPYRPLWTALGVIGLYALAAVTLSSWGQRFLSFGIWRALHYLSLPAFIALTAHGILAGTDAATPWMLPIYITSALAVLALLALRLWQSLPLGRGQAAKA